MKKILLPINILLIFAISIILIYSKKENQIMNTKDENKNNMLSIMVEKEAGTGNYNDASSFPSTGYYLNKKLSKCVNGSKISFSEGNLIIKGNKTDRCYAYFDKDELGSICRGENLSECFIKNYKKDSSIIYHDGSIKDETGNITDANDYSYRYAGADEEVKNFVCLDSKTKENCESEDDLYRIIGFFKNTEDKYEIKLIKYDYVTSFQLGESGAYDGLYKESWPYTSSYGGINYKGTEEKYNTIGGYYWTSIDNNINEWAGSKLRKINLNDYYLNTYLKETKGINTDNLIEIHNWSVNGHSASGSTPKVMYDNEMNKVENTPNIPTKTKIVEDKIGLIYASDYGYAASSSSTDNWTIKLINYDNSVVSNNNWMFMGLYDWTISRYSSDSNGALGVSRIGSVYDLNVMEQVRGVRPAFYIKTAVKLTFGNGTKENPYRLTY